MAVGGRVRRSRKRRTRAGRRGPDRPNQDSILPTTSTTESAAPVAQQSLIHPGTVREAARLAARQTELRLLGDLAAPATVEGLLPYLELHSPALSAHTLVQSAQDARFQVPRGLLRDVFDRFCRELETPAARPSTLIVVAHQDDETIGAGAQLCRLQDAVVLHVTDGAPQNAEVAKRYGFASIEDYAYARRAEAVDALALAGLTPDRVICLGLHDGELPHYLVELAHTIADYIDVVRPEVVLTHPYEGGHTDHDAIAFAVHLACGVLRRDGVIPPVVLELTSYHNRNGERAVFEFLPSPDVPEVHTLHLQGELRELKERMYDCFRTQQECLSQFPVSVERFRPAPRYNFERPPHDGLLDYERLSRRMSGEEWLRHAERALQQLRTRRHGRVSLCGVASIPTESSPISESGATTRFLRADAGADVAPAELLTRTRRE